MSDTTKNRIFRIVIHALVLFLLYVLQVMIFSRLRIFNVAPLLLPLAVVGVGLFEGPSWGGFFGLAAGVLLDSVFFDATILFTLTLTAAGMGVGLLSTYLLSRGFPSYGLCCAATLMLIAFFQLFPHLVFHGAPPPALFFVALVQTLYSLLFVVPLYFLARAVGRVGKGS